MLDGAPVPARPGDATESTVAGTPLAQREARGPRSSVEDGHPGAAPGVRVAAGPPPRPRLRSGPDAAPGFRAPGIGQAHAARGLDARSRRAGRGGRPGPGGRRPPPTVDG